MKARVTLIDVDEGKSLEYEVEAEEVDVCVEPMNIEISGELPRVPDRKDFLPTVSFRFRKAEVTLGKVIVKEVGDGKDG